MNDIFTNLNNASRNVYDEKNNVVSCCFVLVFSDTKDQTKVRPFLIVNKHDLLEYKNLYVLFESINNGVSNKHRINIDTNNINEYLLLDTGFLAYPLAGLLNTLKEKGIDIILDGIPGEIIPDVDKIESLSSIECFTWFVYDSTINRKTCIRCNNSTPINKTNSIYIKSDAQLGGCPVFIVNNGSYVENNSVNIGGRVLLFGVISERFQSYEIVTPMITVLNKIKEKYKF